MHTLAQLNAGELKGLQRLTLNENLTEFPDAIFDLADTLEILDLSHNQLTQLPNDLWRLKRLKIIFCSNNDFTELPAVLGQCENLEMIGFKSNRITTVPESSLPAKTRWLILTDNQIASLPSSIGDLYRLQKLALAGNRLTHIPETLGECRSLELIRLSANQLQEFPRVLLSLPKLAWLAFAGNPFCPARGPHTDLPDVKRDDLILHQILGQGASGVIYEASWRCQPEDLPDKIAVKVFKGEVTSDGYPEDELDMGLSVGFHPNVVQPLAKMIAPDTSALVMALIDSGYRNLGLPPTLVSCTRDTFIEGRYLSVSEIEQIITQMQSVVRHLQQRCICHGDLYAHNVLINAVGHIVLGDFGAASSFAELPADIVSGVCQIEQRALAIFIEDTLELCHPDMRQHPEYQRLKSIYR